MLNSERFIYQALKNIAKRKGYSFQTYSFGWIVEIRDGTRTFRLTGYTFDINPSSGVSMAMDKYATHCLLEGVIPSGFLIPSAFVPGDWKAEFIGTTKSDIVEKFLSEHEYPLVLKDARGSQGNDVFKIANRDELLKSLDYFEDKGCDAVLEPFVKSGKELRMLFLDGEMPLAYYKIPGTGWKFNLSQ
jgi:D-alanine-D-alanine ligase-like ATP-grasp enzyme